MYLESLEDRRLLSANITDPYQLAIQDFDGSNLQKDGTTAKVGFGLSLVDGEYQVNVAQGGTGTVNPAALPATSTISILPGNLVPIDASPSGSLSALETDMQGLGMQITGVAGNDVSALLPVSKIEAFAQLSSLESATPADAGTGSVTTEGDKSLLSDATRRFLGVNGAGETVGILSDSYNNKGGAATDVVNGDLPGAGNPQGFATSVNVLQDLGSGGSDEGRAMLQIVHDVAPGANLSFATASLGQASFANNITALRTAGATVIADDVFYFQEPYFQDGVISQAVDASVVAGVPYFALAGNSGRDSYEAAFKPDPGGTLAAGSIASDPGAPVFNGGVPHDFGAAGQYLQNLTVPDDGVVHLGFQWNQPYHSINPAHSAQTDLDIYLLDATTGHIVAGSTASNIGGDPIEELYFQNTTGFSHNYNILITNVSGPNPTDMKWIGIQDSNFTVNNYATNSSTSWGHENSATGFTVGAADYVNTPAFGVNPAVKDSYSSAGGMPVYFDVAGNPLSTPSVRQHPDVVAIDGVTTAVTGTSVFNSFHGTSAAAPHAAAVAALMLEARPGSTPTQIYSAMRSSAAPMLTPVPNFDTGFGLLQSPGAMFALGGTYTVTVDAGSLANDGTPDTFRMVQNGANDDFYVDGTLSFSAPIASIARIDVNGSSDADTLTVDESGGVIDPAGGIHFVGGGQAGDNLVVTGGGSNHAFYTPGGSTPGSGAVTVDGSTIDFSGLAPVAISGMSEFTFVTPNSNDVVTIDSPAAGQNRISGTSGGVAFESVTFFNIANVKVDTATNDSALGNPNDTVTFSSDLVAAGLQSFTVDTGAGNDTVDASKVTSLGVTLLGGSGNDTLTGASSTNPSYIDGGDGNDVIHTSGGGSFFSPDTILAGSGADYIFVEGGYASVEGGEGGDIVNFVVTTGVAGDLSVQPDGGNVQVNGPLTGAIVSSVEELNVMAGVGTANYTVGDLSGTGLANLGLGLDRVSAHTLSSRLITGATATIQGTTQADTMTAGMTTYLGVSSYPTVTTSWGNVRMPNFLSAPPPNVVIQGLGGDDTLQVNKDFFYPNVTLDGGDGNDTLIDDHGGTTFIGGAGNNVITSTAAGTDTINASSGNDTILVQGTSGNDAINLALDGSGNLVATVNGVSTTYVGIGNANVKQIEVDGTAGNNTLTVDSSNGPITVPITFDGGTGNNALDLVDTANTATSDVYSPGALSGQGTDTLTFASGTETIHFANLTPVYDNVAGPLTVNGSNGDDAINYIEGNDPTAAPNVAWGQVSVNNLEPINFTNKTSLAINGLAGSDTFNLNNPNTPTDLASISVDGGDPSNDTLIVNGTTAADTIDFAPTGADAGSVTVNALPSVTFAKIEQVSIDGQGSNDTLTYTTPAGPAASTLTFTPGATANAGTVTGRLLTPPPTTGPVLVPLNYSNIDRTGTLAIAHAVGGTSNNTLFVNGLTGDDNFNVTGTTIVLSKGPTPNATATSLSIVAGAVGSLVLSGQGGNDTFNLSGTSNYDRVTVQGNGTADPSITNLTGDGTPVAVNLGDVSTAIGGGGLGIVTITGNKIVNLNAAGGLVNTTDSAGPNTLDVTPTGSSSATMQVEGQDPVVNLFDSGTFDATLSGPSDQLVVNGTAGDDTINATGSHVTVNSPLSLLPVNYASAAALKLNGLTGNDTFNVTPSATVPISVDGGDPVGVNPPLAPPNGDQINIVAGGSSVAFSQGPHTDEGGFVVGANQPVSFTHIERASVSGPGPVTVSGTNEDDQITVTAIDATNEAQYGAVGADGVQDFAVQISDGLTLAFIDAPTLQINALAGNDNVVVQAPAPGNENWNVDVGIDGGPPTASGGVLGDTVSVETLGTAAQTVEYAPSSSNGGAVDLPTITSSVTLTNVEYLTVNGNNNNDPLTVTGTASSDAIAATPGPKTDAGFVEVGNLLGLTYQGLGATGSVTVDGNGGTDTLTINGTPANDSFGVANTGAVTVNANLPIQQTDIANLVLNGLAGDDLFNLAGGLPYTSTTVNGGEPSASDIVNLSGATVGVTVNLADSSAAPPTNTTIGGYGGVVTLTGVEVANLDANGHTVIATGTAHNDRITYTPTGLAAGTFTNAGLNTTFNFSHASGALTVFGGGGIADQVIVDGTPGRDLFAINAGTGIASVTDPTGTLLEPVQLGTSVQILSADGLGGQDTFQVTPAAGIQFLPKELDNLLININGGADGQSNALVIQAAGGGPLAANQFVINNRDVIGSSGTIRTFAGGVQWPDINYTNIKVVSPNVASPGNLLNMGPDNNEPNESQQSATVLGWAGTIQVSHAAIFPNDTEFPGVPADNDVYRVTAQQTGTLDFVATFHTYDPALLPAGGNLNLQVLDAAGNVVATASGGAATFGAIGATGGARVRVPDVAGQTYFLRVFGANPNGTPNSAVVNGYDLSVTETPAIVPFNLELSRSVAPGVAGSPDTGDLPPDAPADDTGRSQLDDVTHDNQPRIYLRLSDGVLLNDLPGNGTPNAPPVGVVPIPFSSSATASGFRVAIFDGNNTQTPVGFASQVAGFPGLYQFDFPTALADGVHHITAEVQMVDPASPTETGFGGTSASLDLTVDTAVPPVAFGTGVPGSNTGLDGTSDSGVGGQPATLVDRVTNTSTPIFYGVAEANSIVRLYDDVNNDGVVDAGDIYLGQTTAIPIDGTNANPGGQWRITSNVDLNNPALGFPHDGVRRILANAEDLAGNLSPAQSLTIFLDTQGPKVNNVSITGSPAFPLFATKLTTPAMPSPTPLVNALDVTFNDQPVRVGPDFVYPAVNPILATTVGNYVLVAQHTGPIAITSITFADSTVSGTPGVSVATLHFAAPLPDDRYTLTISDHVTDNASNALDGEFNGATFPSGNGTSGGKFVGSFTVDSRPEIGVYSSGTVSLDINGNGTFDPQNSDANNRDAVISLGYPSDRLFAGTFSSTYGTGSPPVVNGFDKLGAYGFLNGQWRWLLDLGGLGSTETERTQSVPIDGLPVAANFDGVAADGAQLGLFDGHTWYFDVLNQGTITAADLIAPATATHPAGQLASNMIGLPVVGDFDGDGHVDLGTYQNGLFEFDLSSLDVGGIVTGHMNATINVQPLLPSNIGFAGVLARPVAADMNADGTTDLGVYWPGRTDTNTGTAQWYMLISDPAAPTPAAKFASLTHTFQNETLGGRDLYYQFGDQFALPLVGNFDPPASGPPSTGGNATTADADWISRMYSQILGREPGTGELTDWVKQVNQGMTPTQVAQIFVDSNEHRAEVINQLYEQYLGREADPAGTAYWTSVWNATGGPEMVHAGIIGSAEYYQTASQLHPELSHDAAWVTALYHNILHRDVDQQGLNYWTTYIQTHTRQSVVLGFVTSDEYRVQLIDGWFQTYLGRALDSGSAQSLVTSMRNGETQDELVTMILASSEYRNL